MKKPRSDSAESAVKAMLNAAQGTRGVPAHVKLRKGDAPFWDGILSARARDEWTDCDLVVAAQLARCQHDIETESVALDAESTVIENARGTKVMNARLTVLEQLARREMAMMRSLRMAGPVAGRDRDQAGKRKIERQSAKLRAELEEEDFLAT